MYVSSRPSLPPIFTVNQVPTSVEDVGDFIVTGTLTNDGTKDIKVVTDPSGILFTHFRPDVFDFELKGAEPSAEKITKPDFVGAIAKWSIETYLVEAKKEDTEFGTLNERGTDSSGDEDDSGSQVSTSESSKTSAGGSSKGEEKVYPRYTTEDLKAGSSIEFEYTVGQGYDFTESGAGAYSVKLRRDFFWVLVDDVLSEAKVNVEPSTVEIEGKLSAPKVALRRAAKDGEGDTTNGPLPTKNCLKRPGELEELQNTVEWATKLKQASVDSLKAMNADGSDRSSYEKWFGNWEAEANNYYPFRPRQHVSDLYSKLRSFYKAGDDGGYTYDCGCDLNMWAWVNMGIDHSMPDDLIINLCDRFRIAPVIGGADSKAGTLIHEATHFPTVRPRARDIAFTFEGSRALSSEPFQAIKNANSYEYFSEGQHEDDESPWSWEAGGSGK